MTRLWLILMLALCSIASAWAVRVSGLYQADVPTMTQMRNEQDDAMNQGFIEVLMKLSGDSQVDKNPVLKSDVKRGAYFVKDFSYAPVTSATSEYVLQIHYNKPDTIRLLKNRNVPYWDEDRPVVMVWLAELKPQKVEIIGSTSAGNILNSMKEQSKRLALPLIFPVMDVTDRNHVTPDDVLEAVLPVLQSEAKRYKANALLIGTIQNENNMYQSEWKLVLGTNQWNTKITDKDIDSLNANILSQVSQTLLKYTAVKPKVIVALPLVWLQLEVANVIQQDDLNNLMEYLKQLKLVQQIELAEVDGDVVNLSVRVQGSLADFEKNAANGHHLILKSQDPAKNKLTYEWVH